MIKFIKKHVERNKELIKDNSILFFSIFAANAINFLFHFFVGRVSGPSEYGVFGVLLSIVYMIVFPLMAVQTVISKFVAELNVKGEEGKMAYLFWGSLKKIGILGIILSAIFIVASPLLSYFLNIGVISPLIILGASIVFAFLIPVLRGFLQGLQKFKLLGFTFISDGLTKVLLGIPLLFFGFGVNGAIGAFALSFFTSCGIAFYYLKNLFKVKREKFNTSRIYKYSFPVIIMLLSLIGLFTLDVVLVKRFFNPVEAGQYAALSLFGRVIFFATMSIGMVMFPKVSEMNSINKNSKSLLTKSILITLVLGLGTSFIYFLIPKFIINLLFGSEFLGIANLLGVFGLIMTVFSICYVISHYNIALNRTKFLYLLLGFNLLELVLISLFHKTLVEVVISLIIVMVLLFLSLIIYTIKNEKTVHNNPGL